MKTIKVFLASSEELKNERLEFSDLILQLNDLFEKRDLQLKLVKWEHLDSSMGAKHKQEEYNDKLKECELCLTLYWTKFGDYTTEELETAYKELKEGRNPRKLYVFFKDTEEITPELQQFKDSFATKYGHFFCKFENVDTMRLQFLLQLEAYQNNSAEKILKVENQQVLVEGQAVVNLNNVPFAAMNKEFVRLRDGLEKTNKRIARCRKRFAEDPNDKDSKDELNEYLSEMKKLEEQLKEHQEFLFDMARKTSRLSSQRISARSAEAIRLFNEGKASEANGILNTEDLERDSQKSFDDYEHHTVRAEEARERIELLLNDWQLKTRSALVDERLTHKKRVEEAHNAHKMVIIHAQKLTCHEDDKSKYASLIFDFAHFAQNYNLFSDAIKLYEEELEIRESLATKDPNVYLPYVATTLNNLAALYEITNSYDQAESSYFRALEIRESLATRDPNVYLPNVAMTLNNLAILYEVTKRYDQAESGYLRALEIIESLAARDPNVSLPNIAMTLNNLTILYKATNRYDQAESSCLRALDIYESLATKEPNVYLPNVATILNNLAILYSSTNRYDQAESTYFRALEIRESLVAKEPNVYLPHIAETLYNLGRLYGSKTKDMQKAEACYTKAANLYMHLCENFGVQFFKQSVNALRNLLDVYDATGQIEKAAQIRKMFAK